MQGIEDKIAIVTGGAQGIGAATCRKFIAAGARVVIGDINGDRAMQLADELGSHAAGFQFDAADTDQVKELVEFTVAKFGGVDFLFNNAAIMSADQLKGDTNPIDIDFALWDKTFAVNARGYLAGCKYTLPHMLERGGGVIIMTSSGSGLFGDISNVAYSASKAAVMSLVRSVATMYGQKNIRCNSVCPGVVRSDGGKENVHGPILEIMRRQTVLPRLGHPDDIAGMTVFLCSDEAGYITGQNIIIDGGAKMKLPYYSEFTHDNIAWGGQ